MGFDPGFLRCHVESRCAVNAVAVHQRHRGHFKALAQLDQLLGRGRTVEETESGARVKLDVVIGQETLLKIRQVGERSTTGTFSAHLRHDDPIILTKKPSQNILQLSRRMSAPESPLVSQKLGCTECSQALLQGLVITGPANSKATEYNFNDTPTLYHGWRTKGESKRGEEKPDSSPTKSDRPLSLAVSI